MCLYRVRTHIDSSLLMVVHADSPVLATATSQPDPGCPS